MGNEQDMELVQSEQSMSMEKIITTAVEKNIPVETMERLLKMRNKLKAEFARDAFNRAMANFQSECPAITKSKEVNDRSGRLMYKYATLDSIINQVKEIIAKNGLSYTIQTKVNGTVKTICIVKHILGHSEESEFEVPVGQGTNIMSEPQKVASAATFSKRYAFCNAFGIMTGDEDDDANSLKEREKKQIGQGQSARQEMRPVSGKPITDKQKGLLKGLLERAGFKGDDGIDKWQKTTGLEIDKMTISQASDWISKYQEKLKAEQS